MPNNQIAERMDELIRAVDEIFVGKIPSEDDLYGIHQVLVERRDAELDRQSVTDEAVQRAIGWQEAEKESAQNDWERAGAEWRMEPGAQAQHNERMAAFDLAISALQAYKPTTRKDRIVEEVDISKTETSQWRTVKPMTNYDHIMRDMTVEQMAELFVRDETRQDYPDDIPYDSYTTEHTPGYYCFRDDAVKAEIEWLKKECDA